MKKNKKTSIFIVIVLSIILGTTFLIYGKISSNQYTQTTDYNNIDEILKDIMSYEVDNFHEDTIKQSKMDIESILENSTNNDILCKANFISGYIDTIDLKNKEAIEKFNKSRSYFEKDTYPKLKVQVYYELSKTYLNEEKYEKSKEMFGKVIAICKAENMNEELVKLCLVRDKDIIETPDGVNEALQLMEDTLKLAKEINYKEIEDVYLTLGITYWYADKMVEGMKFKLEALSICEEKNLNKKSLDTLTDIGLDYLLTGDYSEGINYFKKALEYNLDDPYEDADSKSYALLNLCEAYTQIGDYENAKIYLSLLDESIKKQKDGVEKENFITCMYVDKADLETRLDNPLEAKRLLDVAADRFEKSKSFSFYDLDITIAQEYGDIDYKLENYEDALIHHKYAEKLTNERGLSYLKDINTYNIYLDYKSLGDYDSAMKYLEKNNEIQKKLKNDKSNQYSQYLLKEFESKKNLQKISQLQESGDRMRVLLIGLFVITTIIVVFSSFIYNKNREINRLNKLFKDLSVTDSLTKLPNRRALDEYLAGNWTLYKKTHMPISFAMIDIDYFKKYNDNYGHPEGDVILELVAKTIKQSCRNSDFISRYGGEEFTIIMLNTNKYESIDVVERVRTNIQNLNIEHKYSKVSDIITLSIGITTAYIGSTKDYDEYIKKADDALYKAKQEGRNTYIHIENVK